MQPLRQVGGNALSCSFPALGQRSGSRYELFPGGAHLIFQFFGGGVRLLYELELSPHGFLLVQQFLLGLCMMLFEEMIDLRQPLLYVRQPLRVSLGGFGGMLRLADDVVHFNARALQAFCPFCRGGHEVSDGGEGFSSLRHLRQQIVFIVLQQIPRRSEGLPHFLSVSEDALLVFQLLRLSRLQCQLFQFFQLKGEEVLLLPRFLHLLAGALQPHFALAPSLISGGVGSREFGLGGYDVEGVDDEGFLSEQEVLVLRMDVGQSLTDAAEQTERSHFIVDEGTAFPGSIDFPAYDDFLAVAVNAFFGQ